MHKRPIYTGLIGAVNGVASVVGPLLGGMFDNDISGYGFGSNHHSRSFHR